MKYFLALDSGTTSTRASLFSVDGKRIASSFRPLICTYPSSGHVHQDPMEIYVAALDCINEIFVKQNIKSEDIIGLGITNQRETSLLFDKESGMPLTEAIVWQSNETSFLLDQYEPYKDVIKELTGLTISPYFSSSKIRYLLDKYNLQKKAEEGKVLFATIDTWLIYKLTDGKVFATDATNASRTQLYNINTGEYDERLLKIFNISKIMLPEVRDSTSSFGYTDKFTFGRIEICGVGGDQQCALLGHGISSTGGVKITYGTGLFCLLHTGEKMCTSLNGLLTTIALKDKGKLYYALEGSVFIGGAAVQWIRDGIGIIRKSSDSETLAKKSSDDDIIFVPSFNGLGTPYWDSDCKGAILGITRATTKYDIAKATLEGIAYQAYDVINSMKQDACVNCGNIYVDGGAANNDYLMQFQSNILNAQVLRKDETEITSLGAAVLVGLNKGIYNLNNISTLNTKVKIFSPNINDEIRDEKIKKYHRAIEAVKIFK
ncbi:MAG TPA: glycerol kinase [Firmicutes bacterium]|nr:glycerol kinase [Bacillota bacterium]